MVKSRSVDDAALIEAGRAVDRYRPLAGQLPGVHGPDLACALGKLAALHGAAGQPEAALHCATEAVATLLPEFLSSPTALRERMSAMAAEYLDLCELTGQAPDTDRVEPPQEHFGVRH